MVLIKGIDMPNACTSTQETFGHISVVNCPLYNVCKHRDTIRTNYRPTNCPLVDIVTCKGCKHMTQDGNNEYYCDLTSRYYDPDLLLYICRKERE